jgi:predicted molibdopterin-dependent oxidoreductase YjgC
VGINGLVRGEDDELLIRADKGANSQGAAWILADATDSDAVLERVAAGEFDALLVFGDALDPEDTPLVDDGHRAKLGQLIYVGPFLDAAARQATLLLPATAWAEEEGSLVNFEGRVQWTRRAHTARGEGRPGWRIAADLAAEAGVELPAWTSAADVLQSLGTEVERFKGLTEDRLGLLGVDARPGAATTA